MKTIWIGVGIGPKLRQQIIDNKGKILSAQISEGNLLQGMDALGIAMDTLNGPNISTGVLQTVLPEQWSRNGTSRDISVGYQNVKYINLQKKQRALRAEAKKWAQENKTDEPVTVFIYSMHTPFLAAAWEIKKRMPHTKICLIVPDLPQYMDLKMSKMKKILKALDWRRIRRYMKQIDRYVLYAEPMAEFLKLPAGKWTVMEGSFDSAQLADPECKPAANKKSIMYSGVLDLRYGIPELLDAMDLLDDSYELWLTGAGNAEGLIKERAEKDDRIKFYGYLPSRQDLLNKQAQATMLISPRRDTEEASRYCFPSKLFEYMVSGRPVISCFLDGIPGDYRPYLVELPNATSEQIAAVVTQVAQMPADEQAAMGIKAKAFVLEQKNKNAQAKKIAQFMGIKE